MNEPMTDEEYQRHQADLKQMHSDYEDTDQAEYEAHMDELDARDQQTN